MNKETLLKFYNLVQLHQCYIDEHKKLMSKCLNFNTAEFMRKEKGVPITKDELIEKVIINGIDAEFSFTKPYN
jgi:hypothetical protein